MSNSHIHEEQHMVRARIGATLIAEASDDEVVAIEGNYYFPPSALRGAILKDSPTGYSCLWKGVAQYHDVVTEAGVFQDAAWSYPAAEPSAIEMVGADFSGYIAFDEAQVTMEESG
jgi:uncharacterized protein (DUF427 family)